MFNFNNKPQTEALDTAIDDLLEDLQGGVGSDHEHETFNVATENLIKLMKLKQEINPTWRPSPDAILAALASVGGILLVLHHEAIGNAVTSKAFGFVGKMMK